MFFTSFLLLQAPLNVKNTKPLLTQKHLEQRKSQVLTRSATGVLHVTTNEALRRKPHEDSKPLKRNISGFRHPI